MSKRERQLAYPSYSLDSNSDTQVSRPFTEGAKFLGEFFEGEPQVLDVQENASPSQSPGRKGEDEDLVRYQEAAGRLEQNDLWRLAKNHLVPTV